MQRVPFYSKSKCKSVRVEHFLANPRGDPFRGTLGRLKIDLRIDLKIDMKYDSENIPENLLGNLPENLLGDLPGNLLGFWVECCKST